ncbi:MAG: tyrosine-type recombinase/integrase [Clostridia bacterium]|nr:tyrosine-type recombinase/integrase [Clostridia bacterium]
MLYDNGWELKDIQQWLGHADIGTTGNIYTHLTRLRKESIGRDLENVFRR